MGAVSPRTTSPWQQTTTTTTSQYSNIQLPASELIISQNYTVDFKLDARLRCLITLCSDVLSANCIYHRRSWGGGASERALQKVSKQRILCEGILIIWSVANHITVKLWINRSLVIYSWKGGGWGGGHISRKKWATQAKYLFMKLTKRNDTGGNKLTRQVNKRLMHSNTIKIVLILLQTKHATNAFYPI